MYSIDGTTITLVRGDTATITVDMTYDDNTPYVPEEGDEINFLLYKNSATETPTLTKAISPNTRILQFSASDTEELPYGDKIGKYVYDIELSKSDGTVDTFIHLAEFILI